MKYFISAISLLFLVFFVSFSVYSVNLTPSVHDDPLVRMPGTQPDQGVALEAPNRCLNCHEGYNQTVEPGFNWKGSMMAQAARDPIFWACLTVAAQDSAWAIGTPNAVDLCERCHFPQGWLAGRSDPPNASAMTGSDFDGLHCDFCHTMWDPFFDTTFLDTTQDWDEATNWSDSEALVTRTEDESLSLNISLFNGSPFFNEVSEPQSSTYTENTSGQYFVSPNSQKRASFVDAEARHQVLYSRYHKSKYFCATCHDVSNPALANSGKSGLSSLPSEDNSAYSYFHVERTWSEFMLSAYGQDGGAATNPEFQVQGAPDITHAAKCQDCHMRDVVGAGANKKGVPVRPDDSTEHPNSGQPLHDLTGGNAWISFILASLDSNGPVYDPVNYDLLGQGPAVLTLDLTAGQSPLNNGAELLAGAERAKQQLKLAATIKDLKYTGGKVSFKIQNNSGHKLISGFPEGRRMFINVKFKDASGTTVYEINPYDYAVGTLKGLPHSASSPPLGPNEAYVDELVYEVHPSSDLTVEDHTFHFVLATGRYKDNRIPPKGFDIDMADERMSEPVVSGSSAPGYFTAQEYAGGYDAISLSAPSGAASAEVTLYYQGTSREYIEFLRDEIRGTGNTTLPASAYIIQTDPFFNQLKAWGNTIWELWKHNHGHGLGNPAHGPVAGIVPFAMAQASVLSDDAPAPCVPPTPSLTSANPGNGQVTVSWQGLSGITGYSLYYDQAGKASPVDLAIDPTFTSFVDTELTNGQEFCYKLTSWYDCIADDNDTTDTESAYSNILCATPASHGQEAIVQISELTTGTWVTTGKGKNRTSEFVTTDQFVPGDTVEIHTTLIDGSANLISGATVQYTITQNDAIVAEFLSDPSGSDGVAAGFWTTEAPNKKGRGGTPTGSYTITVTNVTASGYVWDETQVSTTITLQ